MSNTNTVHSNLNIGEIREKLASKSGPQLWRSLNQIAESPEFLEYLKSEFPGSVDQVVDPVNRRKFLQLMGASLAFAGMTACTRQPEEKIVPYVKAPEEVIPGKSLHYASTFPLSGFGQGILVESHDGRPTKIEGNPRHPASLGATSALAQASILDLYDPDRIDTITEDGRVRTWDAFYAELESQLERYAITGGEGLRILTGTITSPTITQLLKDLLARYPEAVWHSYEPVNRDFAHLGSDLAFQEVVNTYYNLEQADVVLSLDADFLFAGPGSIRYTKDLMKRKRSGVEATPSRLYVVESTPTLTGTVADHRLTVKQSQVVDLAVALAAELGISGLPGSGNPINSDWVKAVAEDLKTAGQHAVVVPGDHQSPLVHGLAHLINQQLGNRNTTTFYTPTVESGTGRQMESLLQLVSDMQDGRVGTLFILDGNPVYNSPGDIDFQSALGKVGKTIYLTPTLNETSPFCNWVIPKTHYLEDWGDIRSYDGTVSIVQPLIEPLYRSTSITEILGRLLKMPNPASLEIVREYWTRHFDASDFEKWWRNALHEGFIPESELERIDPTVKVDHLLEAVSGNPGTEPGQIELNIRPDSTIYDGSYNNNGWLQELPKPLTKLTWDNAVFLSPQFAEQYDLQNQDLIRIRAAEKVIQAAVWIQPGHPESSLSLHLGYGRSEVGRVGQGTGFDAYPLTVSDSFWNRIGGIEIEKTGDKYRLASTQDHSSMEGRHLIITGSVEKYRENPDFVSQIVPETPPEAALYPGFVSEGHAWGMTVDLNACIGCNACVVACQAENNISVVGKDEVLNGREMHWIRVDRYYSGSLDSPKTLHQPVMCQQCENAPCESVCPVAATVHSDEGLNDMVYNRCVGTRYCSNNCPYKVRRFNFLLYSDWYTETLKLQRNPNVTIRSRGVMEKCTYCIQRIKAAKIDARVNDRALEDGEIKTACQQVCPADAIVFGDINDPESRVSKLKENQRNYGILNEIKTLPRTTYLARITNPNAQISEEDDGHSS